MSSQGRLSVRLTPSVPPAWNSNVASFDVAKHSSKILKPLSILETTSLFLKTRISLPRNCSPQPESFSFAHDLTKKQTVSEKIHLSIILVPDRGVQTVTDLPKIHNSIFKGIPVLFQASASDALQSVA